MKRLNVLFYINQQLFSEHHIHLNALLNLLLSDNKVDLRILADSIQQVQDMKSNLNEETNIDWLTIEEMQEKHFKANSNEPLDVSDLIEEIHAATNVILLTGKRTIRRASSKAYAVKTIPYIHDLKETEMENHLIEMAEQFPYFIVESLVWNNGGACKSSVLENKIMYHTPILDHVDRKKAFANRNYVCDFFASPNNTKKKIDKLVENLKKEINLLTWRNSEQDGLIDKSLEVDLGIISVSEQLSYHEELAALLQFMDYGKKGKPVILTRTKLFERVLGTDYPLFIDNSRQLKHKVVKTFQQQDLYQLAAKRCYEAVVPYQFTEAKTRLMETLWKFNQSSPTILFAGHDFKFLTPFMEACRKDGFNVLVDKWHGHKDHDEEESFRLLELADVIFCEWGLGNAVFYSNHKKTEQKLFIRVHRQELETDYLLNVDFNQVTNIIAISPYMLEEFIRLKQIPRKKMKLIPNMINKQSFRLPKTQEANYHLGMLGIIPKLKRLDRAIDIIEKLWKHDNRYKLFIKGKLPHELKWMKSRKEDTAYFESVFNKIEQTPWKDNIVFESHGPNVAQWFTKIGFILSTSDIEGFHLAPMEGMVSGTEPVVFNWPGSDMVYPDSNIVTTVDEAVDLIIRLNKEQSVKQDYDTFTEKYDEENVIHKLKELVFS